MAELIAKSPLAKSPHDGPAPLTIGAATLAEGAMTRITAILPLRGQRDAVSAALAAQGLAFPTPGTVVGTAQARIVWTGRDQAFLIGAAPDGLGGLAAVTDQSDGWARLLLSGAAAEHVLARLYPLDLRLAAFPADRVVRAPLNHMASVLIRLPDAGFEILVFRSMARTAWHEIATAMTRLHARVSAGQDPH